MTEPDRKETYLGDGLYVSFDGWQIWLRAPRQDGDHKVALEPEVFTSLLLWAEKLDATAIKGVLLGFIASRADAAIE